MSSLPVDLRRMREKNRKRLIGNFGGCLLDIVHAIEVCVVNAREIDSCAASFDCDVLIEQHPYANILKIRNHQDAIVVAENTKCVALYQPPQLEKGRQRDFEDAERLPPIIPCEYAEIVSKLAHEATDLIHGMRV